MTIHRPALNKSKHLQLRRASDRIDYNREKPTFCLRYVDPSYCISFCDKDDKAAFAERIRQLSTMTWNQIINADRHGFGMETISRDSLPKPPANVSEDVRFIALRFSGIKPMVGYRSQSMFHIVWFDRDLNLYYHS